MLRAALLAALLIAAAGPVMAAGAAKADKAAPGQYVDLAPVAIPIVVKGELINYVFVTVRLQLSTMADATKLRTKEPFFRDALVRAAHRDYLTNPKDYMTVDGPRLQKVLLTEAVAIAGPKDIKSVVITSQAPKKRMAPPQAYAARGGSQIKP